MREEYFGNIFLEINFGNIFPKYPSIKKEKKGAVLSVISHLLNLPVSHLNLPLFLLLIYNSECLGSNTRKQNFSK